MAEPTDATPSRTIRLLIVDDAPETVQNIKKLLRYEREVQVVGVAAGGREAIARATALRPDVILMDINLRDMDGLKAAESITDEIPTGIVMMSVQSEREYMARAMAIGARGYLVKPFSHDDLIAALRTAAAAVNSKPRYEQAGSTGGIVPAAPQHRIITVYSPKGGVGRSVVAANLAITLQQVTAKSVVLVDANLQAGDIHVLLNITTTTSIDDLREAPAIDRELINGTAIAHEGSGLRVVRAPLAPESAEMFTADTMKVILSGLREHFDYVVVDTATTFSEATLIALEMADCILAITTLEVTTINRVSQFFDVAERLGYPRSKVRLVCNRVDGYYGIRPAKVEARLRTRFLAHLPEDNRLVVASVNRGVPFVLTHKAAPISQGILALAQRLDDVASKPELDQAREKRRFGPFRLSG